MAKALAVLIFAGAALLATAGGASGQQGVWNIITRPMFQSMLSHRGDNGCQGAFYTNDAFIEAASKFPGFGTTGDDQTRRRELAAFFGQTSHETTGMAVYILRDCIVLFFSSLVLARDTLQLSYAHYINHANMQCMQVDGQLLRVDRLPGDTAGILPGERSEPDGPSLLWTRTCTANSASRAGALKLDLLNNPDLVSSDPVVAFKTAIWFWMTPQSPKPSCHAVMTNGWTPSAADRDAGRLPGYGLTTNIINGGQECGRGQGTDGAKDRVGYFKRYCDMLGVGYGDNMACKNQKPYGG
ncbi:Chitinase 11 [Dichanthelium oligosanthes]|uniref:chitinase n=1 Tax=Dichanthelium oligosanthes TaxID=888268 RepID=A0A1E5UIE8_9POAL|nr:Chitinase 11 [Dichanthelium oligosanthes]